MNKRERLEQIKKYGIDAGEALMLSSEEEINDWIDRGLIDEDFHYWWSNAQEELRCMMAEFI
ncbi:MAG: hypothetical protein CL489_08620 [Acidobacteria bacterium]|nr:hypothetical protein [Acidobacteriota bacterium]|tara:strand:- start:37321 stop:37506 length:186 start_codon:yes stop_codon:yes gene_type:complete